jgi:hypothetical protein
VREYSNALLDLFSAYRSLQSIPDEVAMALGQLPRDGEPGASFPDMDARTSQRHFDTYIKVAEDVANAIVSREERLQSLAGACAVSAEFDNECFGRFLENFGKRALRRPLGAEDVERLSQLVRNTESRAAYRLAITQLLASPDFTFHVELGQSDSRSSGREPRLTPYELANRLSFHFWRSAPDQELLRAAGSSELDTEAGYRAQVERLSSSQRARATWFRFFREWFKLDHFGGFARDRAFDNFAGSIQATPELYEDAVWEIEQLVGFYTFDAPGSYEDLLTSPLVVTRSLRLAKLYGVRPWDGRSAPLSFPTGQRSGLLTRAAVLISANHTTNPFQRGAFVRRQLLCQPIEAPSQRPPEAFVLPAFDPRSPTRARYERKVAAPGCKGCHDLFSPYGYALEAYDALGRYRESERLVDGAGDAHGRVPIDVKVDFALTYDSEVSVSGPVELSRVLADSPLSSQCLARHYFRFTFRREEREADACTLNFMLRSLTDGGLQGLFRDVAYSEAFRSRVPPPASRNVAQASTAKSRPVAAHGMESTP